MSEPNLLPGRRSSAAVLAVVAALAALVVAVLGVRYAGQGDARGVDARLAGVVYGVEPPWRSVALALDSLGEPVGAAALVVPVVAGCLLLRRPRAAVFVVVGVGLAVGVATLLKHLAGRTIHGDNLSYPSGHTAFLTALALAVATVATRRRGRDGPGPGTPLVFAAALAAGAVMGWAQVALGAHYPTDVLGGWCTALAVVPATAWLVDRPRPGRP
ncbi:phosphatase PAP2 family protein [Streptomyces sp. SP17BM10]|uniref:phosphatase PAP2 family protein n=1 Tax=Streptomyces sp. SP17BM10 TaxID=3002530 RepID=UPI002E773D33|nr:phosphatase PAP2 family protein [Streptomyces sp. SP17BM10]MEE1786630.1 phosphatase PAP2 family protein [Streptomyces sp. SP17BM10]